MREKRHSRIVVAFPLGEGGPRSGGWGALVNDALVTIYPDLFHPASPIQPPPLRGTTFHRKVGVSTRAPSLGRGCRAQRGGVGFLFGRRSRLLFAFPIGERGPRSGARVLVYRLLETISPLFHTARTLSGSLRSPPSPRGEGFVRRYSFFHICVYSL